MCHSMTKLAAGSLLRTVFSRADAVLFGLRSNAGLQLPLVAQWEAFWSVTFPKPGMFASGY